MVPMSQVVHVAHDWNRCEQRHQARLARAVVLGVDPHRVRRRCRRRGHFSHLVIFGIEQVAQLQVAPSACGAVVDFDDAGCVAGERRINGCTHAPMMSTQVHR
jgi:hypothetical protein